jgi:hypothetical protein
MRANREGVKKDRLVDDGLLLLRFPRLTVKRADLEVRRAGGSFLQLCPSL